MRRRRRLALLATVALGVPALAAPASGSAPVPCAGTVQLTGTSNVEVRTADGHQIVELDFTGLHDLCLADGSLVTGTVTGHLVQRTSADGDLTLRFDEVVAYGGGTLGYRGQASLSNGRWQGHVRTVGAGTGPLAGIRGQGEFWPTGPGAFADVIDYVYGP